MLDFFDSGMVQLFDSERFRGTLDHHESKLALAVENIDPPAANHSTKLRLAEPLAGFARTKAGGPQFTGIERYRKTMLNAFHRIAFRKIDPCDDGRISMSGRRSMKEYEGV